MNSEKYRQISAMVSSEPDASITNYIRLFTSLYNIAGKYDKFSIATQLINDIKTKLYMLKRNDALKVMAPELSKWPEEVYSTPKLPDTNLGTVARPDIMTKIIRNRPKRAPVCVPQNKCPQQPISLLAPAEAYAYKGVGTLLPKFTYEEGDYSEV